MDRLSVLVIDNFDSFTFNLVDEFQRKGCHVITYRNNTPIEKIREAIKKENIGLIVISPGGFVPREVPLCKNLIAEFHREIPIFGVCLGYECIVEAFGGKIGKAPAPVHGKSSKILHDTRTIFSGLDNPMMGGRYHSQMAVAIPGCL